MNAALFRVTLFVAVPLVFAGILLPHPPGGPEIFADVRDDVDAWLFVHTGFLLAVPLLGICAYLLTRGIEGVAATVSRIGLVFFLVFYAAYETTVGVATGILVDHANSLPAGEQAAVAGAIQELNRNAILSDPSLAVALGSLGWIVATIAAAVALRGVGVAWPAVALIGLSAAFVVHPPPVGPVALACFAAGALLAERSRARSAEALEPVVSPV